MKIAGKRIQPSISFHASAEKLRQGALFNDETQRITGGRIAVMPKGVYRYRTHREANDHWDAQTIQGIVRRNTR